MLDCHSPTTPAITPNKLPESHAFNSFFSPWFTVCFSLGKYLCCLVARPSRQSSVLIISTNDPNALHLIGHHKTQCQQTYEKDDVIMWIRPQPIPGSGVYQQQQVSRAGETRREPYENLTKPKPGCDD